MLRKLRSIILFPVQQLRWAASLVQFSSSAYRREALSVAAASSEFSSFDLGNVIRYRREQIKSDITPRETKKVLIEMLWEYPAANFNSCLVAMLLEKKYAAGFFALTEFGDINLVKTMANAFGINRFVGVYKSFDFKNHMKAFVRAAYYGMTARYKAEQGISLKIDGQEFGDLVYDEYLRDTCKPTVSRINFHYLALIYNSLYRYYRYKEIILEQRVTDIIITHNVYARFGLIIKAAAALSNNITIWITVYSKPLCIARNLANKRVINKAQYFKKEYCELIKEHKSADEIERDFQRIFNRRMEAQDANQVDVSFAYANNEIHTMEDFKQAYNTDDEKKIFVMAHAFVDAVRFPLWQNYSDNYVWLRETLILLADRSATEEIYVKPHPAESLYPCKVHVKDVVDEINREYGSNFICMDKKVHNWAIFDLAKAIFTSHGSIGIEAPCLGVKVIAASSCLYEGAGAIFQAKNISDYQTLVKNVDTLPDLTPDQVLNAKIAFLWFNQYMYADSELLSGLSRYGSQDRAEAFEKINEAFAYARPLEQQEVYKAFSDMIDRGHNDFVCV